MTVQQGMDLLYQTPREYRYDLCEECGRCLAECPQMHLEPKRAAIEVKKLRNMEKSKALRLCTTCFACDFICPNGCNPAELIQNRWGAIRRETGLAERARYFLPHSRPNFRTHVIDNMSPREKELISSWADLSPAPEVCYPGCNIITTPLLALSPALEGLDIRGALEYCCGEMYFRMGLFDQVRRVARKTQVFFEALEARKVTILCTAGYYMFTEVLPHFGADYAFEVESYLSHVKRRMDSGELELKYPLDMVVTVQDSCYAKHFGKSYMDAPREILSRAGARVVEMKNSRECMLCCGIGAGFSPYSDYNPARLTAGAIRVMRAAKKSGAEALVTYCSGCLQMFSTGMVLYRTGLPVYHLLEIIDMALGVQNEPFHSRLGRKMLMGVARHQFPKLLSTKRFEPPAIHDGMEETQTASRSGTAG